MRFCAFILFCLTLAIPCTADTITVDDDEPADFSSIQAAINYSWDGDTVLVYPGTYNGLIKFNGRAITLTSMDPDNQEVVASTILTSTQDGATNATVTFDANEDTNSVIMGFTITSVGSQWGVWCNYGAPTIKKNRITSSVIWCDGIIENNIITDRINMRKGILRNNTIVGGPGVSLSNSISQANVVTVKNNIIAFNETGLSCIANYAISNNSYNCFWENGTNFSGIALRGDGDFIRDPMFVDWTGGDYHLKSEAGRWNPSAESWIIDAVTSPCVDTGDPSDSIGKELNPNGGRINIGAYGGTIYASKSPNGNGPDPETECVNPPSKDFNNDCKVDLADFAEFLAEWLSCGLDIQEACWQ